MIPIILPLSLSLASNGSIPANEIMTVALLNVSAVISGAIFGDHSSPISDTSILSSTASACPHLEHIYTQMPYTLLGAFASTIGYIIAGFTMNPVLGLGVGLVVMVVTFLALTKKIQVKVK